ncbi:N-acetyltransferase [Cryobacterium frigoriphilum]|uniref:N-acetyltransferase n=1 Tax=Cryobacterium frigoriphilum TaxID=1259150 RepID=A0A4R9A518_9MICO|nr:GNAT family protein [Cryobacterium frigoriphilum]TFD52233.1 N-acetyltransferase [Cryobacterium frigoriphilum]
MTDPRFFAEKPTLTGERVLLCSFTPREIEAMGAILADPDVLILTGSVHTSADAHTRSTALDSATRRWYETRADQPDRLDLAIVDRATSVCVGEAVLNELSPENDSCNFRILIGPAGRDRGLGTEATRLIIRHAFQATSLHRIELEVFAFNPRAQHVYESAGFALEGRRRDAHKFDNGYVDALTMSILRPESP